MRQHWLLPAFVACFYFPRPSPLPDLFMSWKLNMWLLLLANWVMLHLSVGYSGPYQLLQLSYSLLIRIVHCIFVIQLDELLVKQFLKQKIFVITGRKFTFAVTWARVQNRIFDPLCDKGCTIIEILLFLFFCFVDYSKFVHLLSTCDGQIHNLIAWNVARICNDFWLWCFSSCWQFFLTFFPFPFSGSWDCFLSFWEQQELFCSNWYSTKTTCRVREPQ